MDETERRRVKQIAYNTEHGITPKTIYKTHDEIIASTAVADVSSRYDAKKEQKHLAVVADNVVKYLSPDQRKDLLEELNTEMLRASADLEFERAAQLRDEIRRLTENDKV